MQMIFIFSDNNKVRVLATRSGTQLAGWAQQIFGPSDSPADSL
jgi:hypothetical protein